MFLSFLKYGVFAFGLILVSYLFLKRNKVSSSMDNKVNNITNQTTPKSLISSVFLAIGVVLLLTVILVIYYNIKDIQNYNG